MSVGARRVDARAGPTHRAGELKGNGERFFSIFGFFKNLIYIFGPQFQNFTEMNPCRPATGRQVPCRPVAG